MQVEIEAGNRFVESGGGQLKPEIATWQEHLTETIDDYLDSSPQAQRATTIAVFALILALSGVSCSIWPVLLPPFSNEQKLMVEAIALKRQMAALEREVAAESVKAEKRANVISDIIVRNEEAGRRERTNERTVSQRMEDLERQLARMNAELIEIKKMVEARTSGESKPSEKKD